MSSPAPTVSEGKNNRGRNRKPGKSYYRSFAGGDFHTTNALPPVRRDQTELTGVTTAAPRATPLDSPPTFLSP